METGLDLTPFSKRIQERFPEGMEREAAQYLCAEISLQTYCRTPSEMIVTPDWLKLQMAEALAREIRALIDRI